MKRLYLKVSAKEEYLPTPSYKAIKDLDTTNSITGVSINPNTRIANV